MTSRSEYGSAMGFWLATDRDSNIRRQRWHGPDVSRRLTPLLDAPFSAGSVGLVTSSGAGRSETAFWATGLVEGMLAEERGWVGVESKGRVKARWQVRARRRAATSQEARKGVSLLVHMSDAGQSNATATDQKATC